MDDNAEDWELEGVAGLPHLLQHYDVENDAWSLPQQGRFWDAVRIAHAAGRTGAGTTIAIIDGTVNLSIPRLAQRVTRIPVAEHGKYEPTDHCTAIALLVSAIAPEARLDVYEVCDNHKPRRAHVVAALNLAKNSAASVINLSLSRRSPLTLAQFWALQIGRADSDGRVAEPTDDCSVPLDDNCDCCTAASAVAGTGKTVVAAACNEVRSIACPARSSRVLAAGFMVEERRVLDDGGEVGTAYPSPHFDHSRFVDVMIPQLQGALGTSFSAPLLTGFLALGTDPAELTAFLASTRWAARAEALHQLARETQSPESLKEALAGFERALAFNPHHHERETTVQPCAECALFAEDVYVNCGLALLAAGDWDWAEPLLRTVAAFAPASPHPRANLEWLKRQRARGPGG